ncbi:MAG: hypothetical protein V4665_02575 [Patescibacteria group bacterium]
MRDILTSPKAESLKRMRKKRRLRICILVIVFCAVLVGALAYFSFHPRLTISSVVVTGTRIIDAPDVEARVRMDLKGRYFSLFSRANSFIYPRQFIRDDIIASFPRIETLAVSRDSLSALRISITERAGSYLYCGSAIPEIEMDIGENCYFVNDDGYIFDTAPYFSGNLFFKYYLAQDPSVLEPLGSQMMDADRFHELARFIDKTRTLGFKPIYITLASDGIHTLYLDHVRSDTTPKIIFNADNDLSVILDNLSASMSQKEFADEIKNKYTKLLYIDLRFDNKVLYKFNE